MEEEALKPNISSYLSWMLMNSFHFPDNYTLDDFLKVAVEYKDTDHWFNGGEELILVLCFCIVILAGLTGNIIVCLIICRSGGLKSTRNWYLLNLAISDISACAFCIPFMLVRLTLKNWQLGWFMCKLVPTLQTTYVFVSTFTILAIAVDRYQAIVCSSGRDVKKQRTKYVLPIIWITSVSFALPLFVAHVIEDAYGISGYVMYSICREKWESNGSLWCYTVAVLIIQYLSPVIAIVALHVKICKFLHTRVHERQVTQRELHRVRRNVVRHKKNMILLTTIAIAFAVTWLPMSLVNLLADFDYRLFARMDFPLIHAVCLLIAFTSVCINPVVYGWFNTNIRRDFGKWCRASYTCGKGFRNLDINEEHSPRCRTRDFDSTTIGMSTMNTNHLTITLEKRGDKFVITDGLSNN
ncbi:hypothetical protein SNE40_008553 [Patella caerulea]|uniref:G-protein coupled receptors family 1 profile domain-containing protein n=1 Tax=Patella caerulea TaxID=87958 RepID=A0AAN8K1E8_PATCE